MFLIFFGCASAYRKPLLASPLAPTLTCICGCKFCLFGCLHQQSGQPCACKNLPQPSSRETLESSFPCEPDPRDVVTPRVAPRYMARECRCRGVVRAMHTSGIGSHSLPFAPHSINSPFSSTLRRHRHLIRRRR